jgi:hypothetical protein
MSFQDALAQQPHWVQIWSVWIAIAIVGIPFALLIWRDTRVAGLAILVGTVVASIITYSIFLRLGYVRLLGLGHIIAWSPLVVYLWFFLRRTALPAFPHFLIYASLATLVVSLAFDVADTARYIAGERAPMVSR